MPAGVNAAGGGAVPAAPATATTTTSSGPAAAAPAAAYASPGDVTAAGRDAAAAGLRRRFSPLSRACRLAAAASLLALKATPIGCRRVVARPANPAPGAIAIRNDVSVDASARYDQLQAVSVGIAKVDAAIFTGPPADGDPVSF